MTDDSFAAYMTAQARLCMLKALAQQVDGRLNEALIEATLDAFGYRRPREWVRTQLIAMRVLGAVTITETGSVMIAGITRLGLDHVERRQVIDGVAKPSPEA